MQVTLDSLGQEVVSRHLVRYSENAVDVSPVMPDVFDLVRESERRQFNSQGADGSGGWAPLAESTRKRKAALGQDPRILRATGALFADMTGHGGGQIAVERSDGGDFGTTLPYAKRHQKGGGRLPQRPVIQLPERDRRGVIKIIQRFIVESGAA